jgi:hypothetical protein
MKIGCRSGHRVQKNHDFELTLPISDQFRYIVTLRHPIYSLTSWHKLLTRSAPSGFVLEPLPEFMMAKADYWRSFAIKWWIGAAGPNILKVRYEDLVDRREWLARVATFINGDEPPAGLTAIDGERFTSSIRKHRQITNEPEFDPHLFRAVQERIGADVLSQCGFDQLTFDHLP